MINPSQRSAMWLDDPHAADCGTANVFRQRNRELATFRDSEWSFTMEPVDTLALRAAEPDPELAVPRLEHGALATIARPIELIFDSQVPGFDIVALPGCDAPQCLIQQVPGAHQEAPRALRMIIRNGAPWAVRFQWGVLGRTAEIVTGTWILGMHFMRVDGEDEGHRVAVGRKFVGHVHADAHDYDEIIAVRAGGVPDGFYKAYPTVEFAIPAPGFAPICAAAEGPIVRLLGVP